MGMEQAHCRLPPQGRGDYLSHAPGETPQPLTAAGFDIQTWLRLGHQTGVWERGNSEGRITLTGWRPEH